MYVCINQKTEQSILNARRSITSHLQMGVVNVTNDGINLVQAVKKVAISYMTSVETDFS
jgi:hypothetical protein